MRVHNVCKTRREANRSILACRLSRGGRRRVAADADPEDWQARQRVIPIVGCMVIERHLVNNHTRPALAHAATVRRYAANKRRANTPAVGRSPVSQAMNRTPSSARAPSKPGTLM